MSIPQDPGGGAPPGAGNVNTAQAEAAAIQQQTEISERIIGNIENAKELTRLINERNQLLGQSSDILKENLSLQNSIFNILGEQTQQLLKTAQESRDISAASAALRDTIQQEVTLSEDLRDSLQARLLVAESLQAGSEEQLQTLKEITEELERQKAVSKTIKEAQQDLDDVTAKVADTLGMSSKFSETTLGSTVEMVKRMQQAAEGGADFSDMLEASLGQAFNLKNILGDTLDSLKDMVIELDKISKNFAATTGLGNTFQSEIMTIYGATFLGGGTMQEAGKSLEALATGFSAFNPQAIKVNQSLGTTIVNLSKIGVSSAQSVKAFEFFTRTLQISALEASNLTVELAMMGQQMGVTSTKMIQDFTAVADNLAVFGDRSIDVFKGLAAQAKATGMEVSSLVALAESFNQFDKAADSASKLNAVLGTQLSTLQLLSMDYDDRLSYLRQEVQQSVGNFGALDQYTQMYVAQAMGLKSAAEAQRFLNMSQAEFLKYQSDMEAANTRQEDLEAMTRELVPVLQQFKLAFMQLAMVFAPYVSLLAKAVAFLAPMLKIIIPLTIASLAYKKVLAAGYILELALFTLRRKNNTAMAMEFTLIRSRIAAKLGENAVTKIQNASHILANKIFAVQNALRGKNILLIGLQTIKTVAFTVATGAMNAVLGIVKIVMMAASLATSAFGSSLVVATGGLILIIPLLFKLLEIFGFKVNPFFFDIPRVMGENFDRMAQGVRNALSALRALNPFNDTTEDFGDGFGSLQNLQNLDMSKLATDLEKVKSVMLSMANAKVEGVLAIRTDGAATSLFMGSEDVMKNITEGKLTVDVNIPEMKPPKIELKVDIDGEPIRAIVRDVLVARGL